MDSEAETVSLDVEAETGVNSPGVLSPVGRSLPFLVNSLEAGSREERLRLGALGAQTPVCCILLYRAQRTLMVCKLSVE